MRHQIWCFLTSPSELHDGLRLIDLLFALIILCLGVVLRWHWNSDWVFLSFPLAIAATIVSNRNIPDCEDAHDQG